MNLLREIAEFWPARVAFAACIVLLVGRIVLAMIRQPVRRVVIGTIAVIAALMVIPLSLLPGWLPLPVRSPAVVTSARESQVTVSSPLIVEPIRVEELVWVLPELASDEDVVQTPNQTESTTTSLPIAETKFEVPANSSSRGSSLALWAYAFVSVTLLVRLILGQIGLQRLWLASRPAPESVEQAFRRMARSVCPRAQLRVTNRSARPVCFGVLWPRVVIPSSLVFSGDALALRAILAHELGHLSRRDPFVGWLLGLSRAIYFVVPWLSGIRREVRVAQEHLADADAARTAGPADYADLLIRLTRTRPAPLGAAGVRGPSSELYRRVTMLLKTPGQIESRCPRRWAVAIGGGLTALAIAAVGMYVPTRSADAAEPQRKEAEEKPAPKPAAGRDNIKDTIDKLLKDAGDDPEARKQIEELLKAIGQRKPVEGPGPVALAPPAIPVPPAVPILPGVIGRPDLNQDFDPQEMIRRYMEAMTEQMKAIQARRGVVIGANGAIAPRLGGSPFGAPRSGRLGIRVERPSDVLASQLDLPNGQGLVCTDVPADSPAGKAGVRPNDILLEIAGKPVSNNQDELVKALKDIKPDATVDIVVLRKGKKETVKGAKLPEAKEQPVLQDPFGGFPGVRVLPAVPGLNGPFPGELVAPQLPVPPGAGGPVRGIGVVAGPGESVRVEQVNDAFTVFYTKNGIKVTVTGSKEGDGAAKAESIEIEEDGKSIKAESIEKLPKEYQELAKSALKAIK